MYAPGAATLGAKGELVWVNREGHTQPVVEDRPGYGAPRLSPDGQRLAVEIDGDIWVYDVERGTRARLTSEGGNTSPIWTPDGERVSFMRARTSIDWMRGDGSGEAEPLRTGGDTPSPHSWSPDGKVLAFYEVEEGQRDIWMLPLGTDDRTPVPFLVTRFWEVSPSFSPDGRWVAYVSRESGRDEVYVTPYPGPGGKNPSRPTVGGSRFGAPGEPNCSTATATG